MLRRRDSHRRGLFLAPAQESADAGAEEEQPSVVVVIEILNLGH
jgi:hypothetical protein